jgi:hypothetical protein
VTSGSSLAALKTASPSLLSIRFIVDLYTGMSGGPHRGRLAGAIGRPRRRSRALGGRPRIVGTAPSGLADWRLHPDRRRRQRRADDADGGFRILGHRRGAGKRRRCRAKSGDAPLAVAAAPGWRALGTVPTTLGRYKLTSGVESLTLSAPDAALCAAAPLGLFTPNGATLAAEDAEGLFVFPDPQAFPMNPGDQVGVLLTALAFGQPAPGRQLDVDATLNAGDPGVTLPASVTTDAAGTATVSVQASDPGTPRGPIDGRSSLQRRLVDASGIVIPGAQSAVAVRPAASPHRPHRNGPTSSRSSRRQHDVPGDGGDHRPQHLPPSPPTRRHPQPLLPLDDRGTCRSRGTSRRRSAP